MSSWRWTLIQYNWCPYKRRKLGCRNICWWKVMWRDIRIRCPSTSPGERPGTDPALIVLRKDQLCLPLHCRFVTPRTVKHSICLSHPVCGSLLWHLYQTDKWAFCASSHLSLAPLQDPIPKITSILASLNSDLCFLPFVGPPFSAGIPVCISEVWGFSPQRELEWLCNSSFALRDWSLVLLSKV